MRLALPLILISSCLASATPVKLAQAPALSPDGKTLAFSWCDDIWTVPSEGGAATRLTFHASADTAPAFSPDGKTLAFLSERSGSRQLHLMPMKGGEPVQQTFHTEGYDLFELTPDGKAALCNVVRDHSWLRSSRSARLAIVPLNERKADTVLFDDYATEASLSPDGRQVLFVREGDSWWRQGYQGSQAGQIWLFDRKASTFKLLRRDGFEYRSPLWKPDGKGFYFLSNKTGTLNLWEQDLAGQERQLTQFKGDSVVFPSLSRDGSTLVFRCRFDLYRWSPGAKEPVRIDIEATTDLGRDPVSRILLDKATDVTFAKSGLELAFIAGGDVWVMDTELREPRQVTDTPEEERGVIFSPDQKTLWFVSDAGGNPDLWTATRADTNKPWWDNSTFTLTRITQDLDEESKLKFTPTGKHLAYVKGRGDLWLATAEGKEPKLLFASWDSPSYDFSPDGKWLVYSQSDEWFNEDIWLRPIDGSKPPFNLSRHPDNDSRPVWSPDGKMIAWSGNRELEESDIFYLWLLADDEEKSKRERTLVKAREKFSKKPSSNPNSGPPKKSTDEQQPAPTLPPTLPPTLSATPPPSRPLPPTPPPSPASPSPTPPPTPAKPTPTSSPTPKPPAETKIELEDIHERIHRVRFAHASESALTWSPDSKKLAFTASIDGKRSLYTLEFPEEPKPKLLSSIAPTGLQWLSADDQITGLQENRIHSISAKTGSSKTYAFRVRQTVVTAQRHRSIFDQCWRTMRDHFYDERLGNKDWNLMREKYLSMATAAPHMKAVAETVQMLLGELNGSHLGFMLNPSPSFSNQWREETAHIGLRFDVSHSGPGWKVRDVLPKSPASQKRSLIRSGEILLKIDGRDLLPDTDPSTVLNGAPERDVSLLVQATDGKQRTVTLRPISFSTARALLYPKWIKDNRAAVDQLSKGTLGYLHISAMDDASFQRFQEELYAAGAGKQGLVIDVRENGGGSTADHLLTALTPPLHSVTVPRGGDQRGYPQDRLIYATWSKPIIVLCNQNSFSNAEIFSHAVKVLKRGQLVGVPTAGGVISTGAAPIMDVGTIRVPFRGWYGLESGQDMELNGAKPDHLLWPQPGDLPKGKDDQLTKAIELLLKDVQTYQQRPTPPLQKSSQRNKR